MVLRLSRLMEDIRKQPLVPGDSSDAFVRSKAQVTPRNPHHEAAVQYLTWALESIEKVGSRDAAAHTRSAILALRSGKPRKSR